MDQARVKAPTPAQKSTTRQPNQVELSAPDFRLPDGLKQGRQQDAHHRCIDTQQGSTHRSQSAQVTPEGQEPANQHERGEKESDERQGRASNALKPWLQIKAKKGREAEHRPWHRLGCAVPREKLLQANPTAGHQRLLQRGEHHMNTAANFYMSC